MTKDEKYVLDFKDVRMDDVPLVGGKNASLGEMIHHLVPKGVNIPGGFIVTAEGYKHFIKKTGLGKIIKEKLSGLDTSDLENLYSRGRAIRKVIKEKELPDDLKEEIVSFYEKMEKEYGKNVDVAIRSSATAEDSPEASFAGQHETYLNIRGREKLLEAVKAAMASLFTNRAISYREDKGFKHLDVYLSVGIQKMVRSDMGSAGVAFTLDTESGFRDVILINGTWGLGELIVQGEVTPDEWLVFKGNLGKNYNPVIDKRIGKKNKKIIYSSAKEGKATKLKKTTKKEKETFTLSEDEVLKLAKWCQLIEDHYSKRNNRWMPMDIEWGKDGKSGELFILQARPETVHATRDFTQIEEYSLKKEGKELVKGASVLSKIASGKARMIMNVEDANKFKKGEILVTDMTNPDWEPVLKRAAAVVTDKGGRTCFGSETKVLTKEGFLDIKEVHRKVQQGEKIETLSLDSSSNKLVWRKIKDSLEKKSSLWEFSVSPTLLSSKNKIRATPDHKFITFNNRELVKEEISSIAQGNRGVIVPYSLPKLSTKKFDPKESYLTGAFITDGYTLKNKRGGYIVGFTQKKTEEKEEFIERMKSWFSEVYREDFKEVMDKRGNWLNLRCYRKEAYKRLENRKQSLLSDVLTMSKENLLMFLAGVLDGDGNNSDHQIQITVGENKILALEAVVISALRLGLMPNICKRKSWYVISFSKSRALNILQNTVRLKLTDELEVVHSNFKEGFDRQRRFVASQILGDLINLVNSRGGFTHDYITEGNAISAYKIKKFILPQLKGSSEYDEVESMIENDFAMQKVKINKKHRKSESVYDLTIEAEEELDHNYVVFTEHYTPVVVSNCHAAIVSRELGIPAIVGSGDATEKIKTGDKITVDTTGSEGIVYEGELDFDVVKRDVRKIPETKTKVMMNIATPDTAFEKSFLPNEGVGLAREEFIIASDIGIHPNALVDFENLKKDLKKKIERKTVGWKDKTQFYIDKLAYGIAKIAASFYPKEVIVRFSDFKTNEYRTLLGGELYEPEESNPMLGWRGASRYYDPKFKKSFAMEVRAIEKVRKEMGFSNVVPMVPFCRTAEEGRKVLEIMKENGLDRKKEKELKVYVMCEIPSNVVLAEDFLKIFDGMSIGSNDLTQLVLGLDRDSEIITEVGDERDKAVKEMVREVIHICRKSGKYVGICGDAPSTFPKFAEFLIEEGIESISLNHDVIIETIFKVHKKEKKLEDENSIF